MDIEGFAFVGSGLLSLAAWIWATFLWMEEDNKRIRALPSTLQTLPFEGLRAICLVCGWIITTPMIALAGAGITTFLVGILLSTAESICC
jgi:hypothetical protein